MKELQDSQMNREVINKLPKLLSSPSPSLSGDCSISLSSLVSKAVGFFTAVVSVLF